MRYEFTDDEWTAIRPLLSNEPRCAACGRPAYTQRRWVLHSGAPCRDLPGSLVHCHRLNRCAVASERFSKSR
jgi:transposase